MDGIIDTNLKLKIAYSDDLLNWNVYTLSQFNYAYIPNLSKTNDGKIWLFYNKYSDETLDDLFYMSSIDNGSTWESEKSFTSELTSEYYCSIVSVSNSDLIAFYTNYDEENFHDYIYKKVSNDGGLTWGQSIPISNSENNEDWPNALIDTEGTIWLVYSAYDRIIF